MAVSKRNIFRQKALQYYSESRQKEVLPRLVSPPVFAFFWILLVLLMVAGITAWLVRVPTYVAAAGVVLDRPLTQSKQGSNAAVVVVFLPVSRNAHVRAGQPILLQIGSTGTQFSSRVDSVEPGILSPSEARQRYGLDSTTAQIITGPSLALTVSLGPAFPMQQYAGSIVSAQLQIGTQRVLSLLSGAGQ